MSISKKFFETPMGRLLRMYEKDKIDNHITPAHHTLERELIISLTSYKPRFEWLHLTLNSILEQTVLADKIILWIAEEEIEHLPTKVKSLNNKIEIRATTNLRSYKKIIPTLELFPEAYVIVCDDDIYYPRNWIAELVHGSLYNKGCIVARSAHRYHFTSTGQIAPYAEWSFDVQDPMARVPSADIVPIGVGGVVYPPHSLHEDVTNKELFNQLCPNNDDLWLYAMARLEGRLPVKVGGKIHPIHWPGTQEIGLFLENIYKNDDVAVGKLIKRYGYDIFCIHEKNAA